MSKYFNIFSNIRIIPKIRFPIVFKGLFYSSRNVACTCTFRWVETKRLKCMYKIHSHWSKRSCPYGYYGFFLFPYFIHLLFSENPCRPNPCSYNGKCVLNGYGGYKCKCIGGYTGSRCESRSTFVFRGEIQYIIANTMYQNLHWSIRN